MDFPHVKKCPCYKRLHKVKTTKIRFQYEHDNIIKHQNITAGDIRVRVSFINKMTKKTIIQIAIINTNKVIRCIRESRFNNLLREWVHDQRQGVTKNTKHEI